MNLLKRIHILYFIGVFCISSTYLCRADDVGVKLETGGFQIALPQGWEVLNQPTNFFVQQRARNIERNYALSVGTFKSDLALDQYIAIALAGFESGLDHFDKLSKRTGVPASNIERLLRSQIGRQMLESIKQSYRSNQLEVLDSKKIEILGAAAYELHLKVTVLKSGGVIFVRQFTLLSRASVGQIVNITFAGPEDIFQDESLLKAILKTP
jgi:hypothetical protein